MRELLEEFERELEATRRAIRPALGRFRCGCPVEAGIDLDGVEVLGVERQLVELASRPRAAPRAGQDRTRRSTCLCLTGSSSPRSRRVSSQLFVRFLVEPEYDRLPADQHRSSDEVWLFHHQVDRLLLRFRQRPLFEDGTARADEIEKPAIVDVLLEERSIGRRLVDIAFFDVDLVLLQKTSGVTAGGSGRLPIENPFGHGDHCTQGNAVTALTRTVRP